MSKVTMTVKQIMDLGLWDKVCEYKGWDVWILNEGRIDSLEEVEFDTEFEKESSRYEEALPLLKDDMRLFSYRINCSPNWEGEYYGIVFATDRKDAMEKVARQYSWEDKLEKFDKDNFILINLNKFENDCYEVGSHRE